MKRVSAATASPHQSQLCRVEEWVRQESLGKEEAIVKRKPFVGTLRGTGPRPGELGQRPEASLAWCRGDPACEAETASERAVPLSPEIDTIAGADGVYSPEGRVAAPQRPGARDPAGVGEQGTLTSGFPRDLGGPTVFSADPGRRHRVTNGTPPVRGGRAAS